LALSFLDTEEVQILQFFLIYVKKILIEKRRVALEGFMQGKRQYKWSQKLSYFF